MTIEIECTSCYHINRQQLGEPGFELLVYQFDTFSEAWAHQYEHRDHHLTMRIIEDDEE